MVQVPCPRYVYIFAGLTLALDEVDQFEDVMKTAEKAIRSFINDEPAGYKIYEMEHPDVLLWAVWALQQYAKETSREQCRQKYGELLKDIIEFIRQRKHENLFLHENGLLYANGTDKAITWMNSTVNGHPVIPRTGYIVEFNAFGIMRFVSLPIWFVKMETFFWPMRLTHRRK